MTQIKSDHSECINWLEHGKSKWILTQFIHDNVSISENPKSICNIYYFFHLQLHIEHGRRLSWKHGEICCIYTFFRFSLTFCCCLFWILIANFVELFRKIVFVVSWKLFHWKSNKKFKKDIMWILIKIIPINHLMASNGPVMHIININVKIRI